MLNTIFRLGALTVAIVTSPALAADLPSWKSAPAVPPPPPLWTGFYAGLNAGYGFGATSGAATSALPLIDNIAADPAWGTPFGFTALANSGVASVFQSGFVGGGQIGYNFQWSSSVVLGLETDIQGAGVRGTGGYFGVAQFGPDLSGATDTALGGGEITAGVDWLGTARGRLGYLVTPTLLAYGAGGIAYGGAYARASHTLGFSDSIPSIYPTFGGAGRYSDIRVGWTAGGGAEWMFAPNWSLKAEALYYDLGSASVAASPMGALDPDGTNLVIGVPGAPLFANAATTRVRFDGVIARLGLNHHFNWWATTTTPVSAPAAVPLWTGFYAGLNAGYGFGATSGAATSALPLIDNIAADPAWGTPFGFTALANSGVASVFQSGFVGGGQIGYNFQWSPSVVLGLETDIQGAGVRGAGGYFGVAQFGPDLSGATDTALGGGEITAGVDWLGTARGRLGYLVTPTLLAYGAGGIAYGGAYARASHTLGFSDSIPSIYPTFGGAGRYSDIRVGWTAGGGAEWMFAPNWSLKAEALYYDLGSATVAASPMGALDPDGTNLVIGVPGAPLFGNAATTRVRFDGVIARAGVNYHFDWGMEPVVAKY